MKTIVINVGGSLLSPSVEKLFDVDFAFKLKKFLISFEQKRFILCVGGGSIARTYQNFFKEDSILVKDQHFIGVAASNLNATGLRAVLGNEAEKRIIRYNDYNGDLNIEFDKKVLVAAASENEPSRSSDWNSAFLASAFNENMVIGLTNIDGVYSSDPVKNPDAKKLNTVSWSEYLNVIGNPAIHVPGAKYPVDPFAAKFCQEKSIKFYIARGNDLENLKRVINGENFNGTIIG